MSYIPPIHATVTTRRITSYTPTLIKRLLLNDKTNYRVESNNSNRVNVAFWKFLICQWGKQMGMMITITSFRSMHRIKALLKYTVMLIRVRQILIHMFVHAFWHRINSSLKQYPKHWCHHWIKRFWRSRRKKWPICWRDGLPTPCELSLSLTMIVLQQ